MRLRKLTFTTRYVLLVGIVLMLANTILGLAVLTQSKASMQKLISKNMLDVVKSAAGTLDGDVLGSLTKEDVGGPEFKHIAEQLTVFSDSVDIHFIYAVKQAGRNRFVFTVDPDPVDPGEFGEEVLVTDALITAGQGIPAADAEPAADRWGNFYSAYCPVFDSKGDIAGIVGIDFDSDWYERQIKGYTMAIVLFTILSVCIGSFLVFLMTHRVSRRFRELSEELSSLSSNIDLLMSEVSTYSGFEKSKKDTLSFEASDLADNDSGPDDPDDTAEDEIGVLANKIHTMQKDMVIYLDYLHRQAYTDALTMVMNTSAYHERTAEIEQKIADGTAEFDVIVFDLNWLKNLNDNHGHECGDVYIHGGAAAIAHIFGNSDTYRIGGDEFAVIKEGVSSEEIEREIAEVREVFKQFSSEENNPYGEELSMAIGCATFIKGSDTSYRDVFSRADKSMYDDKRRWHSAVAN